MLIEHDQGIQSCLVAAIPLLHSERVKETLHTDSQKHSADVLVLSILSVFLKHHLR
jgi:hypothetical protein